MVTAELNSLPQMVAGSQQWAHLVTGVTCVVTSDNTWSHFIPTKQVQTQRQILNLCPHILETNQCKVYRGLVFRLYIGWAAHCTRLMCWMSRSPQGRAMWLPHQNVGLRECCWFLKRINLKLTKLLRELMKLIVWRKCSKPASTSISDPLLLGYLLHPGTWESSLVIQTASFAVVPPEHR